MIMPFVVLAILSVFVVLAVVAAVYYLTRRW